MRRIILFCCICFSGVLMLVSCKSKHKTVEKKVVVVAPKPVEVIDEAKKDRAYDIGKRLLESCNTSRFRGFSAAEATDKVRHNATKEKISVVCQKINQRNGRFLGLTFLDFKRNKKTNEYTFRYSIEYEKKIYKRELSVTVNAENKVSSISTKEVPSKPM